MHNLITSKLDLAKAFNTVDHIDTILCSIIRCTRASYDLLCDYFMGRQQRVLFNDDLSDSGAVKIGVSHGSILGSLHGWILMIYW